MATTTNYGWTTPDDTDLVKDGAAAIRTLGSSADTTVKNLSPGTTAGDLDYYTSGTAKARLGIGTAGQVLQVNSGATAPEWATFAAGSYTLISTTSITGGTTTLSSIPQTFTDLFLYFEITGISTRGQFKVDINGNGGTTGSGILAPGNSTSGTVFAYADQTGAQLTAPAQGADNGTFHITFPQYKVVANHLFHTNAAYTGGGNLVYSVHSSGRQRFHTAAITSLTISGTMNAGTAYLYGVN